MFTFHLLAKPCSLEWPTAQFIQGTQGGQRSSIKCDRLYRAIELSLCAFLCQIIWPKFLQLSRKLRDWCPNPEEGGRDLALQRWELEIYLLRYYMLISMFPSTQQRKWRRKLLGRASLLFKATSKSKASTSSPAWARIWDLQNFCRAHQMSNLRLLPQGSQSFLLMMPGGQQSLWKACKITEISKNGCKSTSNLGKRWAILRSVYLSTRYSFFCTRIRRFLLHIIKECIWATHLAWALLRVPATRHIFRVVA